MEEWKDRVQARKRSRRICTFTKRVTIVRDFQELVNQEQISDQQSSESYSTTNLMKVQPFSGSCNPKEEACRRHIQTVACKCCETTSFLPANMSQKYQNPLMPLYISVNGTSPR